MSEPCVGKRSVTFKDAAEGSLHGAGQFKEIRLDKC